jgi:general secretion pathway protein G
MEEKKMRANSGFTLVEILIVVVILGILAAIVIPQFTEASTEAKENSLCSDLQTLRSQIELFKVQHNDVPPGNTVASGSVTPDVTKFENQMIYCTDINGNTASTPSKVRDTTYIYGPYLERVPDNPFTNSNDVVATAGTAGTEGWVYNTSSGEIHAAPDTTTESDAHVAL